MRTDPRRIVIAGDWHGNIGWAQHVIHNAEHPLILHLGDFGLWPGAEGVLYLNAVIGALSAVGAKLWFIDGNHEDFSQLAHWRDGRRPGTDDHPEWARVRWLPRGYRWTWHGRTWLACGGGVSLDKARRTEGRDWWPEEEITDEQEAAIVAGGHADVLVSHDCCSGVTHTYPPRPSWWSPLDLARSDRHQERLQRIVDAAQPRHIMHGHLHQAYERICDFGYGPVEVTGLDCDGGKGANWAVLDVATMTWETSG